MWWSLYSKIYTIKALVLFTCLLPFIATAAEFTVSPLAFNYDVERRDIIEDTVTITNNSNRLLRLYASVHEVTRTEDGVLEDFAVVESSEKSFTPSNWVAITRSRLELEPGETRDIPFTIRMHPQTVAGEYSVFVGFAAASNQPQAVATITEGDGVGTLLNITVDKKQSHQLRLDAFQTGRFVTDISTHTIEVVLSNPGTVSTVPSGEIIFYDSRGQEVAASPFNQDERPVADQATETYLVPVPTELSMGKYKALLALNYGDEVLANLNDTAYFYVVNIILLSSLFIVVLFVTMLLLWLYYRRHTDDDSEVPLYVQTGNNATAQQHDVNLKPDYE